MILFEDVLTPSFLGNIKIPKVGISEVIGSSLYEVTFYTDSKDFDSVFNYAMLLGDFTECVALKGTDLVKIKILINTWSMI